MTSEKTNKEMAEECYESCTTSTTEELITDKVSTKEILSLIHI